jgi:hypothetical protein
MSEQATATTTRTFKSVNGKELADMSQERPAIKFIRASELAKNGTTGIVAEGVLESVTQDQYDKPSYNLVADDGSRIVVNSAGSLDAQMAKVAIGSFLQITYLGQEPMESGKYAGKLSHKFIVGVAE